MYPIQDISSTLPRARTGKPQRLDRFEHLIVHRTDGENSTPKSTAQFHIGPERKWSYIGYHFYMMKDGTLYQTLPLSWVGINAPPNLTRVGLVLVGLCKAPLTEAQRKALPEALDEILRRINLGMGDKAPLTREHVLGHCQAMPGHTDCPGPDLLSFLEEYKANGP